MGMRTRTANGEREHGEAKDDEEQFNEQPTIGIHLPL
jgi:hypothetical protein